MCDVEGGVSLLCGSLRCCWFVFSDVCVCVLDVGGFSEHGRGILIDRPWESVFKWEWCEWVVFDGCRCMGGSYGGLGLCFERGRCRSCYLAWEIVGAFGCGEWERKR